MRLTYHPVRASVVCFSFLLPSFQSQMQIGERVAIVAFFYSTTLICLSLYQLLWVPGITSFPSSILGYKLNLINDLFCLPCLPLAMFRKWPNENVSLVRADRMAGCFGARQTGLFWVLKGFWGLDKWYWIHTIQSSKTGRTGIKKCLRMSGDVRFEKAVISS